MMKRKKNVIVLAGTKWQIPLIKRLKEMGYGVIDFNLLKDSPAFMYADDYKVVDILDCEKCLQYAKQLKPAAILSDECDIATNTVAWLSEKLNLRSIGNEMAELYTNKYLMRKFGQENGFATPVFFKCQTIEEAVRYYLQVKGKMIMKPVNSNSSRGVYTVCSAEEVEKHFCESIKFSRGKKCVILEEYIDGPEFTVDGIKTDKGHVSLAISEKKHFPYNENIACSLFFSYDSPIYDYKLLRRTNDAFVNLTGLPFGLTHAEYKYHNGKFYLIEIGARGGGNRISASIVPLVSGVDNHKYLICKTLGMQCDEEVKVDAMLRERCAILRFFGTDGKEGIIRGIKGEDFLRNCKQVVEYSFSCKTGEKVCQATDDSGRIGYYIAYGNSRGELEQLNRMIDEKVEIVLEESGER